MESSRRRWVSITLLSIVIPVGLLVGFRLTGILQEPLKPEIVKAEAVKWSMMRPAEKGIMEELYMSKNLTNVYSADAAFFEVNAVIYWYHENDPAWPFYKNDGLTVHLTASTSIRSGFVHSLVVRFSDNDGSTSVDIFEDPNAIRLYNIEVQKIVDGQPISYIETLAVNQSDYCMLETSMYWVFFDENSVDHEMTVALEVTYFNGTAYHKAVLPIQLGVLVS